MTIWTAPLVERTEMPRAAPERTGLEQWLDFHRDTLLWKCAGLSADQLKLRSVPPSRLSLLGLVRHMAEVERWWFRTSVAGAAAGGMFRSAAKAGADFEDVELADAYRTSTCSGVRFPPLAYSSQAGLWTTPFRAHGARRSICGGSTCT